MLEAGGIFSILTGSYYIRNLKDDIFFLDQKSKNFNLKVQKLLENSCHIQEFIKRWNEMIVSFIFDSKYAYGLEEITGPTVLVNFELLEIISKAFGFEIIKSGYIGLNDIKCQEDKHKLDFLKFDGNKEMVGIILRKK